LLPDIRRSSKDDFLFQQDGALLAHRSRHAIAYLRNNVPEFIEPKKLAWPPIVCI